MCATAAHLVEDVLPSAVPLRQWVLTFPFAWRSRLGYDAPLLSSLTRLFVQTVLEFYSERGEGDSNGKSGAVVAVQRTSSDLKLNPHVHAVFLDGAYRDKDDELEFNALPHLQTRDVAEVLERTRDRIKKYLRRKDLLQEGDDQEDDAADDGVAMLAASAVSGTTPPAGPEWRRGTPSSEEAPARPPSKTRDARHARRARRPRSARHPARPHPASSAHPRALER